MLRDAMFSKKIMVTVNYQELIEHFKEHRSLQVKEKLTPSERKMVEEELVIRRVYQDQPADVPYFARPKRHFLIRSDDFGTLLNRRRK